MLPLRALFPACALGVLLSAQSVSAQTVELRIVPETLPSPGSMQIKLEMSSPLPVFALSTAVDLDPVLGAVEAVALFGSSASDFGAAVVQGRRVAVRIVSPEGALRVNADPPLLAITAAIRPGLAVDAGVPLRLDPASFFLGAFGTPFARSLPAGSLTSGGSVSISEVTPGGGALAAGAVVHVLGSGFTPQTSLQVSGVAVPAVRFVNSGELNFTLRDPADLHGRRVRARNPDNSDAIYYAHQRTANTGTTTRALLAATHPLFPLRTATSATLLIPQSPPGGFVAVALENPAAAPSEVQLELVSASGAVAGRTTFTVPPVARFARTLAELFAGSSPAGGSIRVVASAPLRILGLSGDDSTGAMNAFVPGGAPAAGQPAAPQPELTVTPQNLTFDYFMGAPPPDRSIALSSGSGGPVAFQASSSVPWMTLLPSSGQTPAVVRVFLNPAAVTPGALAGTINITTAGGPPRAVSVTANVFAGPASGPPPSPRLRLQPAALIVDHVTGGAPPAPRAISVDPTGDAIGFTAVSHSEWLSVTPQSARAPSVLRLAIQPGGLKPGSYTGAVTVAPDSGPAQLLTVILRVVDAPGPAPATSLITLSPAALTFAAQTLSTPQFLPVIAAVSGGGKVNFTASGVMREGSGWLSVSPGVGTAPSSIVSVRVNPAALLPGLYTGVLYVAPVTGPAPPPVEVTLEVTDGPPRELPRIELSSSSVVFDHEVGAAMPSPHAIRVESSGGPIDFGVNSDTAWLSATVSQRTTPATVTVVADPEGLAAGSYSGVLTVASATGAGTIAVSLRVTAPGQDAGPVVTSVVNSASQATGPLAPGTLVTLYGSGFGTSPRVFFGTDAPAPVMYASATQINAVVPFEVAGANTVPLEVEAAGGRRSPARSIAIAEAAPALFTADASGRGPVAALNPDGSTNRPSNPVARGAVLQLFLTGAGQTSPQSETGVVSPEARPLALPVTVTIGGRAAEVLYAGSAPGLLAGVAQINARVPADAAPGLGVAVSVTVGGVASQAGTTISIR